MNRDYLISLGIDYDDGLKRFVGNKDLYEKFLLSFKDDTSYSDLIKALKKENASDAFQAAHTLKGLAGNLSMTSLYQAVSTLVEELRAGNLSNVENSLPPVTEEYEKLVEGLKK